jgi:hypothetical protein
MQIQNGSVSFGPVKSPVPQTQQTFVTFSSAVAQAAAILTGFTAEYSGNNDHHLGQLEVQVNVPPDGINGATVTVNVTYGLRDWTGTDDFYDGQIFFAVVGE